MTIFWIRIKIRKKNSEKQNNINKFSIISKILKNVNIKTYPEMKENVLRNKTDNSNKLGKKGEKNNNFKNMIQKRERERERERERTPSMRKTVIR